MKMQREEGMKAKMQREKGRCIKLKPFREEGI